MKYSQLVKGGLYYRFERVYLDNGEVFRLMRIRVVALGKRMIETARLRHDGTPGSRDRRTYGPLYESGLYATPDDAKVALVATHESIVASCERRLTAAREELAIALKVGIS